CEDSEIRSISDHYSDWESVVGRRPCTEGAKQPSQIHAGLRCVGDSSGDETRRSALVDERACQLAVFSGKLPSMEAEIDDKLPTTAFRSTDVFSRITEHPA